MSKDDELLRDLEWVYRELSSTVGESVYYQDMADVVARARSWIDNHPDDGKLPGVHCDGDPDMLRRCPKCRTLLVWHAAFCYHCGQGVTWDE